MDFLNRQKELDRLDKAIVNGESGLLVVYGRRRVGKTRLLLEWCKKHGGLYWVADESSSTVQRQYFASILATRFPGFDEVRYPDWLSLFQRLAREAKQARFRGPIVIDELPYLVLAAPEFSSVFQKFLDDEAKKANLCLVICGSSQRMMQGLILSPQAPLYGRAKEIIHLQPLLLGYLKQAFYKYQDQELIELYAIFGGIPRYWELALPHHLPIPDLADYLILDPISPLAEEASRFLLEESPPAIALKPILDVIGTGVHRISEIASRMEQPTTSLARPIKRLQELGLVYREVPFLSLERDKRALYKIKDEFSRFWYSVVGPYRSILAQISKEQRLSLFQKLFPSVVSETWELLCQMAMSVLLHEITGQIFHPAMRYWHGKEPEWDIVSLSLDKKILVLGESKWSDLSIKNIYKSLKNKGIPSIPGLKFEEIKYCIFVPKKLENLDIADTYIFDASDVLRILV